MHRELNLTKGEFKIEEKYSEMREGCRQACINLLKSMEKYSPNISEDQDMKEVQSLKSLKVQLEGVMRVMTLESEFQSGYLSAKERIRSNLRKAIHEITQQIRQFRQDQIQDLK